MRRFEIQPAGGIGAGFADLNGPRPRCSFLLAVALLLGARQRRLGLGLKGAGKVGVGPRVRSVTAWFSRGSGPTEALQGMPLVARVPSFRPAVECGGLLAVLDERCRSLGW